MSTQQTFEPTGTIHMSPVGRLERILLKTDGTADGEAAETLAIELCARSGAALRIVFPVSTAAWEMMILPGTAPPPGEEGEAHLAKLKAEAESRGIPCETVLATIDDPSEAIIKEARRMQADLIVKQRGWMGEPARLLVGGGAGRITGRANCPVLIVRSHSKMWSRIVLATDGSRSSDAATVMAAKFAKLTGVPVTVLSIKVSSHSERRQAEAHPIVERAVAYMKQEGVEADGKVESGLVDEIVIDASEDGEPLIVLGALGRTGFGRVILGSKTERIVNQAKGCVLVVG